MLSQLVRAILPRRVVYDDNVYEVRPPTVREAVILLAEAKEAMAGNEDSYKLVLHTISQWYPQGLFLALRAAPPQQMTAMALRFMHEGTPHVKPKKVAAHGQAIDWDDVISLYMHTYGVSLEDTLKEPWSGFLVMASQIGRIEARKKLDQLHVNGLPYIKNKGERDRAIGQLKKLAGVDATASKATPEEQKKNLNDLAAQFAAFGSLGKA